ncbi:Putative Septin [Rhizopus microsporus]|nr:Putative Septin [Rhizopus microsporus]
MRNVNNWHWVSKDCRSWAKKYLTEQLVDLSTKNDNVNVRITSLDECNGDVDLNQRKGKLFAIYDLVLKFSWEANQDGKRAFGTISVPEFAYDTDECAFKCTVNQSSEFDLKAKQVVQSLLIPLMKEKLAKFTSDLVDSYSTDLYANSNNKKGSTQNKSNVSLQPIRSCEDTNTVVKTTVVNHSFEFKGGDAKQIYEALLDPKRQSGLGKSTLVNTIFASHLIESKGRLSAEEPPRQTTEIQTVSHSIEENGVRLRLNIVDTPGYGDQVNNENCWEPIIKYIKDQHSAYLRKELTATRDRYIQDTRVHCCLFFITPTGHA